MKLHGKKYSYPNKTSKSNQPDKSFMFRKKKQEVYRFTPPHNNRPWKWGPVCACAHGECCGFCIDTLFPALSSHRSRFAHTKFSLNFLSSWFVIRVNLLHPQHPMCSFVVYYHVFGCKLLFSSILRSNRNFLCGQSNSNVLAEH